MAKYRFHVVCLPHTVTSKRLPWAACAYTQKVLNFCKMMHSLGHEVYHYGAKGSEVECTEHVDVIDDQERSMFWPGYDDKWRKNYFEIVWESAKPYWQLVNSRSTVEIEKRVRPRDFLCIIAGSCQKVLVDRFQNRMMPVEYGIGYRGVTCKYRVFESYSHMHKIYGLTAGDTDGSYYDTVIPNYFDPGDFDVTPEQHDVGNYVLFVGRMVNRKGLAILQRLLQHLEDRGITLICAGQGAKEEASGYLVCENNQKLTGPNLKYLGIIGFDRRRDLMSRARALLAPTLFVEPFGGVVAEAQLCGCPVITTDWGAFTETVQPSHTGYRCHVLKDFVRAIDGVEGMDRTYIRNRALSLWSTDVVRHQYQEYFDRVYDVWDKGWSTLP